MAGENAPCPAIFGWMAHFHHNNPATDTCCVRIMRTKQERKAEVTQAVSARELGQSIEKDASQSQSVAPMSPAD